MPPGRLWPVAPALGSPAAAAAGATPRHARAGGNPSRCDIPVQGPGFWAHGVAFFRRVSLRGSVFGFRDETQNGQMASAPTESDRIGSGRHQGPNLCRVELGLGGCAGISVRRIREAHLEVPDLSPAVFSTRHHRGASQHLPRHVPYPRRRLGRIIERVFCFCQGSQVLGFRFWVFDGLP
jgi:hypothetical protein